MECLKRNIIISDLYGTLLDRFGDLSISGQKKQYDFLINFINEFLEKNNFFIIVTSLGSHLSEKRLIESVSFIASGVSKEKRKQFLAFINGVQKPKLYIPSSEFTINFFKGDKSIIVPRLFNELSIKKGDNVLAAGDSYKDIGMLLKVNELGGKSFYVDPKYPDGEYNNLSTDSIEHLINGIAFEELTKNEYELFKQCNKSIFEKLKKRTEDLLLQYKSGKINREDLEYLCSLGLFKTHYEIYANSYGVEEECTFDTGKKLIFVDGKKNMYSTLQKHII